MSELVKTRISHENAQLYAINCVVFLWEGRQNMEDHDHAYLFLSYLLLNVQDKS